MSYNTPLLQGQFYNTFQEKASDCQKEMYYLLSNQWFNAFLRHTDEKDKTGDLIDTFVTNAYNKGYFNTYNKILDIGCGAGELAQKVTNTFSNLKVPYQYHCIEYNRNSALKTKLILDAKGVNNTVINANAFDYNLTELASSFDFILVSHAAYYANDIEGFMQSLLSIKEEDGFVMMIHETHDSYLNLLREKFFAPVNYVTAAKINTFLSDSNVNYNSSILTTNIALGEGLANKLGDFEPLGVSYQDSQAQDLKSLLEFVVHKPLEDLAMEMMFDAFLLDIKTIVKQNDGNIPILSEVHLISPLDFINDNAIN